MSEYPMHAIKIRSFEPHSYVKEEFIVPSGVFEKMEYVGGGIMLTSSSGRTETFIPYHRIWEIQTIMDSE